MNKQIQGKALVFGDNLSAYEMVPEKHWYLSEISEETMGPWAFEEHIPDFFERPYALRDAGYTIILAGRGFGGGGKSIEQPVLAIKGAGVQVVLAESFARYNFRNSINKGLPAFQCTGVSALAQTGDEVLVDIAKGTVTNLRTSYSLPFEPPTAFVKDLLDAGGLLEYTKKQLSGTEV